MPVVRCTLRNESPTLGLDENFKRTYTHEFLIEAAAGDLQIEVYAGALTASPNPLPEMWDIYNIPWYEGGTGTGTASIEYDDGVFVTAVNLKRYTGRDDEKKFWVATVTWSAPPPGKGKTSPNVIDPLDRPPEYTSEPVNYTKKITKDVLDNRPFKNSAGDLFEDVEKDDARIVLVVTKNMWPLQDIIAIQREFINSINSDVFFGAPVHTAKVLSISSGQLLSENGIDYYAVTFRIEFCQDDETFDERFDNRGNAAYVIPNDPTSKLRVKSQLDGEWLDWSFLNYDGTSRDPEADPLPIPPLDEDAFVKYKEKPFLDLDIGGA